MRFLGLGALPAGLLLCAGTAMAQTAAAPRSMEAIAVSPGEIRCYWLPAQGASGYRVLRDKQVIATLGADAREYDDKGLSPGTLHTYSIVSTQTEPTSGESAPRTYTEKTFNVFPTASFSASADTRHAKGVERRPFAEFDVVIAQASSGGVAAAIEAGRRGLRVALIEPTTRLGGMPVNGLSATDLRRAEHASGFLTRFRDRVKELYAAEGVTTNGLQYEPRIAHQAIKSLLYEAPNVTIYRLARLRSVRTDSSPLGPDRRVVRSVVVEELDPDGRPTGRQVELGAKIFVDATDCGDLAAAAGAPFRLGREARSVREPHNGVIYYDRKNDKALPGSTGKADRRIQSYAYLMVAKDYGQGADKTIPKPEGYRKEDYIHTPAWKESWAVTSGKMPNDKYELNQHPEGGDYQEINYGYPTGNMQERARVEKLYRNRVLGYLYYIQTEQGQKQLGLPDDEYRDTGGFPPLLYVREGRRIVGEQLPDEAEITHANEFSRPESIGLGDYPMDSHAVRKKTDWTTPDMGEGEWWLYKYTPAYSIPLGVMIPRTLDNVFVTTAVSSSHVSFGTFRLEPVRMAFGQAAGIGAWYAIRYHLPAREIPARQIQDELLPHIANPRGDSNVQLAYFSDVKPDSRHYYAIQYLAARGIRPAGETFKPEAPTTRAELSQWLTQLAARSAPEPKVIARHADGSAEVEQGFPAYMGRPADRAALKELQAAAGSDAPLTRAEIARWMVRILPPLPANLRGAGVNHYSDITDTALHADAEALYDRFIDSRSWDNWDAYGPDGKLLFRPDAPLRHDDMFAALYLAQIGLGPAFNDSPVDGRNGREVPSALTETVTVRP